MSAATSDRLYELLPAVYRHRDAEEGYPLKALLRAITEQVGVVEDDITRLYENWFIETCDDWLVPYIGDLVGYRPVREAGEPGDVTEPRERQRQRVLMPRREVANTLGYRRRKGTLALLETLANQVAGWPARAVEFYRLLGFFQSLRHLRLERGRTADLRRVDLLARRDGPFDELSHIVDVRRCNSNRTKGRYNLPSVGLFVYRLRTWSVTSSPACCVEGSYDHCYTFSVLGNNTRLFANPRPETGPSEIAGETNLPVRIRRYAFAENPAAFYTDDDSQEKSLRIWTAPSEEEELEPVPLAKILPADLTDWKYEVPEGKVAVDPELGRIAFSIAEKEEYGDVYVTYRYGFSAPMGGGEYPRELVQPAESVILRVNSTDELNQALKPWHKGTKEANKQPPRAVIEITENGEYEPYYEPTTGRGKRARRSLQCPHLWLDENHTLVIRAENGKRPSLYFPDYSTGTDTLQVTGEKGSRLVLDGLLIHGRGIKALGSLAELDIRHSTLVPGWGIEPDGTPQSSHEVSLFLKSRRTRVTVEHSILGSIHAVHDEVEDDPLEIRLYDSILDATGFGRDTLVDPEGPEGHALGTPERRWAHAVLTAVRSTILGQVHTHAVELAENSLFMGRVDVARSQLGCVRFCYVTPGSRTPRRYHCQPDRVEEAATEPLTSCVPSAKEEEKERTRERERLRVRPRFTSTRYGTPTYCQLADDCAEEIRRGGDQQSEMGAFHDLYLPLREANLRARLEEYAPAGMEAEIIFVS